MKVFRSICMASALMLTACSGVSVLNKITPSGSYALEKNIVFGSNKRQVLDIYTPKESGKKAPVLVFIHGGSWSEGDKKIYKFVGEAFASRGYITAIPSYRLYPEVKYPGFVKDGAAAVANIAKRYPDRSLIIMGHSAGAYITMKIGVDPKWLEDAGVDRCQTIAGIIGLAGPYGDPIMTDEPYITIFPGKLAGEEAPINNLSAPISPLYLAIGDKDTTVADQHNITLAKRVRARGGLVEHKVYPGLSHSGLVKVISRYFDEDSELLPDLVKFIEIQPKTRQNFCH